MYDTNNKHQVVLINKWFVESRLNENEVLCHTYIKGVKRTKIFRSDEIGVIALNDQPLYSKEEIGSIYIE